MGKALLKQAAGKKAQAKSKECNQKDLKDDERNMCIKGMLTDLKGQTSGKHGKAPSKLKTKQAAFKAQRKQILECKKMDAGDEQMDCLDAAKKVMMALGKKKVSDWQLEKEATQGSLEEIAEEN